MDKRTRAYAACGGIVGIFVLVQLGALALVVPFEEAGYQAVEDPQDPTNSLVYVGLILVMTLVMLAIIRYDVDWVLRLLLVGTGAYIGLYVFQVLVPPVVSVPAGGVELNALAWALAAGLGIALWFHPEWYVIDVAGVVMGAGAAGLFGISFGVLPALILLSVLAIYDAISVYGTEHMLTLASSVMDLKVPIVLVVPLSLTYSYLDADMPDPVAEEEVEEAANEESAAHGDEANANPADAGSSNADAADMDATGNADAAADADATGDTDGEAAGDTDEEGVSDTDAPNDEEAADVLDREAMFIGLGDAVIPTVLVASAAFFAPDSVATVLEVPIPALTAMVGTIVGLLVLLRMVLKGRAHAGLPLLNGGTIAGYLIGALAGGMSLVQALGLEPYV